MDHRCAWASFWVSFNCEAVGLRAAFLTSSRRVGILEMVNIAWACGDHGGLLTCRRRCPLFALNDKWLVDGKGSTGRGKNSETE